MSAVFFAVILSVVANSLWKGAFKNLIKNMVGYYSGYIQVHQKGYWNEQVLDNSLEWTDDLQSKINANQNISAFTPRLESFALISSGELTKGCLITGVDPEREDSVTQLRKKLIQGDYLKSNDEAVLLASGLAEQLKLGILDTIYIIGQGYHGAMAAGKYPIKGILTFGAPELNKRLVYLPLSLAQALYDTGNRATSVIVNIHDQESLLPTVEQLKLSLAGGFEVMRWQELMPEIEQHMKTDAVNMQIIQGILYVLIGFGIFGTITMMMVERRRELGMLVAIGMKKINLISLFIIESVFTVITGCLMGIAISIPVVYYLKVHPIRLGGEFGKTYAKFGFEPILPGSVEVNIFLTQGLIVLSMGLILSLYPIYKIIRLSPVDAMKK